MGSVRAVECLLALLILPLVAFWPLWPLTQIQMIEGHDTPNHTAMLVATVQALSTGALLLPRLPVLAGGLGAMNVVYYCTGAYVLAGAVASLGLSVYATFRLIAAFSFVLGFTGMYLWSARFHGRWGGLLSATLLVYDPYYLTDLYCRFALPEFLNLSLLPWVFWAMDGTITSGQRRWGLAAMSFLACAITVHAPTAMMGGLLLVCVCGLRVMTLPDLDPPLRQGIAEQATRWAIRRTGLIRLAVAVAGGISLAAVYWIPAHTDQIRMNVHLAGSAADYHLNFRPYARLLEDDWNLTERPKAPFQLGRAHLALGLASLLVWPLAHRRLRPLAWVHLGTLGASAVAIFMCGAASVALWEMVPPFSSIFYPWRWLGISCLGLAFVGPLPLACLFRHIPRGQEAPRGQRSALDEAVAVVAVVLVIVATHQRFCRTLEVGKPAPTADEILRAPQTAVYMDMPIPRGARVPDKPMLRAAEFLMGSGEVSSERREPGVVGALVKTRSTTVIRLAVYDFPGWSVTLDGRPVPHGREPHLGAITVQVPPGEHAIQAAYTWPPLRGASLLLGLAALLFVGGPAGYPRLLLGILWAIQAIVVLTITLSSSSTLSPAHRMERADLAAADRDWPAYRHWLETLTTGPHADVARKRLAALDLGGLSAQTYERPGWIKPKAVSRAPFVSLNVAKSGWTSFSGQLRATHSGIHHFGLGCDDGGYLYIDGRLVIHNGGEHNSRTVYGQQHLVEGDHDIAVLYFNTRFGGDLMCSWIPPGGLPVVLGPAVLRSGKVPWLEGALGHARKLEPACGGKSPDAPNLARWIDLAEPDGRHGFSSWTFGDSRWTGPGHRPPSPVLRLATGETGQHSALFTARLMVPTTGFYEFAVEADADAWLVIDRVPVASSRPSQSTRRKRSGMTLVAGPHDLVVAVRARAPVTALRLDWKPPGTTFGRIPEFAVEACDVAWARLFTNTLQTEVEGDPSQSH